MYVVVDTALSATVLTVLMMTLAVSHPTPLLLHYQHECWMMMQHDVSINQASDQIMVVVTW